ncbi:protein AATF-like [Biomphalaria glabrata]|uniref:Protein AATF-like n=1 Tax=Biomphalaria glabrata TaxID=6526 RepID=A0A9W3BKK8_BIOGL|nr:protein AATF-like [Biomphalaria glabrata]
MSKIKSSLFDEIFKLQSSAPEVDIDPEDPIDGFKAKLADSLDETETLGSTALRKQAALIADDPKYKGKRTSRNELYSDEEEFQQEDSSIENGNESNSEEASDNSDYFEAGDNESLNEDDDGGDAGGDEEDDDESEDMDDKNGTEEESGADSDEEKEEAAVAIVPQTKSDDREKGHAVSFQLGIWDDLIKGRIALQKMVAACNRLPLPETWPDFNKDSSFRTEANNVHSSVRKLMSALLELQALLLTNQDTLAKNKSIPGDSDEEITSESETEDSGTTKPKNEDDDNVEENMDIDVVPKDGKREKKQKRKLNVEEMEEIISKHHKDFQSVRNNTLSKWDEKTRLASGKIKAKNFAAFEMSVLKQIEQVLANRERLVKRLHQQRSLYKILGQQEQVNEVKTKDEAEVEDWDDEQDIELKLKHKNKQELALNTEIVDDCDFYHVCLRDLIEMKQNEETDPVTASKQWLEIQRLRNKQKRKVDTKASKGRKIRYNVKEKLKNFMTPFDKSLWSDEQKDDLFKSLFGGHSSQTTTQVQQDVTFNIGL